MLPAQISVADFDTLQADPTAWREAITRLAAAHGGDAAVVQTSAGTVLVALLGTDRVLKLYPPFLHDHWAFEHAVLPLLHGKLAVPTPQLLASGHEQGWPWTLMGQLAGTPMGAVWPGLPEAHKCSLLHSLGQLTLQVQAQPVQTLSSLAPDWCSFIARQRSACAGRQQRTGLPDHLLAQLPDFIGGALPEVDGPAVLLTGEYTPMNLLVHAAPDGAQLAGMFDFGDGLLGPRQYDWLGPLCFLAAGHPARVRSFMAGCGVVMHDALRLQLLRLLLLHRYSSLRAQIACPGWQQAPSFEALALMLWG